MSKEREQSPVNMHRDKIEAALQRKAVPPLSHEKADYETWDLADLVPPSDPVAIGEYLGVTLEPFLDPQGRRITGNEHDIYRAPELPGFLIKLDKIPVEPDIAEERFHGYGVVYEMNPEHFPLMQRSFSTDDGSGIIVEEIFSHPHEAEANQRAEDGDPSLLHQIIKKPFIEVLDTWEQLELPVSYDGTKPDNYRVDTDGNQALIDSSIWLNGSDFVARREQILNLMQDRGVEPDRITRATNHLDTLARNSFHQAA